LTQGEAEKRIDAQLPSAEKARLADRVIENEGLIEAFRVEISNLWTGLAENDI
jgi:dephospho-CoA kinase